MRIRRWARLASGFCMVALTVLQALPATAENANVTVGVGDNILAVEGRTAPNAFVTISKDGSVIGTTTADAAGAFAQTFPAQEPGLHQIGASAQTVSGAITDPVSANINIAEHATTTVSLFLPSTLHIPDTDLAAGEPLLVSGEASPSCTITLFIDDSGYASTVTDTNGQWSISLSADGLAAEQHSLFVRVTDDLGAQSYPSNAKTFTVAAPPVTPPVPVPLIPGSGPTVPNAPSTPVITFPPPGATWTTPTITVRGTADPGVQIELFDGNNSLGSVWSDSNGAWSLTVNLLSKDYSLRVRACLNGLCSPLSQPLRFTSQPTETDSILIVDMPATLFRGSQGQPVTISAAIKNGKTPYKITIDWGDGTVDTSTQGQKEVSLRHAYQNAGRYTGWLSIQDAEGLSSRIYFSVDITPGGSTLPAAVFIFTFGLSIILAIPVIKFVHFRIIRRRRPD